MFSILLCQLASMGEKIKEVDKEFMLLCSFPESWNHLVTSLGLSTVDTHDYDTFVGVFLCKEVQKNSNIETSTP